MTVIKKYAYVSDSIMGVLFQYKCTKTYFCSFRDLKYAYPDRQEFSVFLSIFRLQYSHSKSAMSLVFTKLTSYIETLLFKYINKLRMEKTCLYPHANVFTSSFYNAPVLLLCCFDFRNT